MIGVLGDIAFEANADRIRTWQNARRTGPARWATHDVYMGKPKREFIGPGLSVLSLTVRLDIHRGVIPRDELRKMREHRDTGAVLQFTIGGELVGDFTINELDEALERFDRNGVLITATVSLQLEEYV